MSYSFESVVEGINIIQSEFPYYNKDKLRDEYSGQEYSIQMIEKSLERLRDKERIFNNFLKIVIFDCLIGNSDRHHSNWGISHVLKEDTKMRTYYLDNTPLYDNGSSLCAYVNEKDIDNILEDKLRFESLINTKSKSVIGWWNIRPIRHFELLENIYNSSIDNEVILQFILNLKLKVNEESIKRLINEFSDDIISVKMKKLLDDFYTS